MEIKLTKNASVVACIIYEQYLNTGERTFKQDFYISNKVIADMKDEAKNAISELHNHGLLTMYVSANFTINNQFILLMENTKDRSKILETVKYATEILKSIAEITPLVLKIM